MMEVGRNDLCPCGSGKKYKKCCLKKDNVIEIQELKEEKFYKQKNMLVEKIRDFLMSYLPPSEFYPLEAKFKKRTNHVFGSDDSGFFQFWLHFFYRYDNGLRGIEWFLAEQEEQLNEDEKEMAKRWSQLQPKLLQAIDYTENNVIFKDYYSEKTYPMPEIEENIPTLLPWISSFGLIEELDGNYYFNGVRGFVGPDDLKNAVKFIDSIHKESDQNREQIMVDYYPEILASLYQQDQMGDQTRKMSFYHYEFEMIDPARAENTLYNDEDFEIEEWTPSRKKLVWFSDLKRYIDNEIDGEIYVMNVHANVTMEGNLLTFTSYDLRKVNEFLRKSQKLGTETRLLEDEEEQFEVPKDIITEQKFIKTNKQLSEDVVITIQHRAQLSLDEPIPRYNGNSLRQLAENDQEFADEYLKHAEFQAYKLALEQFGKIEVTPDFNTPRRELGLPLSSFITGGAKRESELESVSLTEQRETVVLEEDIPLYESLGITATTIDAFYTKDIISFYQQKTAGKAKATERKYRNSLNDIREIIERHPITSWNDCNLPFWEELLGRDIFELYHYVSKALVKDLVTTLKALIKWLAKENKISNVKKILDLIKQYEPRMLKVVQLIQLEMSYGYIHNSLNIDNMVKLQTINDNTIEQIQKGIFQIIKINKKSVRVRNLSTKEEITITLKEESIRYVEEDMVLTAYIGLRKASNTWKNIELVSVSLV